MTSITDLRADIARLLGKIEHLEDQERRGLRLARWGRRIAIFAIGMFAFDAVAFAFDGVPAVAVACALGAACFVWQLGYWRRSRAGWEWHVKQTAVLRRSVEALVEANR